jgi:outer membrane lipoprotein carrier protein
MMKKLLLALLFCVPIAFAQTALESLDQQLSRTHAFQADFTQTTQSKQFGNQMTKGSMKLERPGKFRWEITDPDKQILISDGKTLWIYDQDLEQVIVQPLSQRLDETPALLLAGKVGTLQQFFNVSRLERAGGAWYELKSRDKEGLVDRVVLNFQNDAITEMQIFDSLGQRTDISFTHIKTNPSFSGNTFTFTPPTGVDVIQD